jgi:hypothetical protein
MGRRKKRDTPQFADALGASRTVPLSGRSAQGPLGLVQLYAEVQQRLKSSGGRPTDPAWTLKRVVPFRQERWEELKAISRKLSAGGGSVSPAQLAAFLVERQLGDLERDLAEGGDDALNEILRNTG